MKTFIYSIIIIALGLLVYNSSKLDFNNLFEGDSSVALIGIVAAACAIVIMCILLVSKKIAKKSK